jgi:hypothetical protein
MREVAPGDIIFSFRDTRIAALGIARSSCYESPKPTEFGAAGSYWEAIGWKIDVSIRELNSRIHPKSHIGELRGLLPEKYSPLRANGDGLQSVYLAEVGRPFAAALFVSSAAKPTRLRMSRRKSIALSSWAHRGSPISSNGRIGSQSTFAMTPRSLTPSAKPSSTRAWGRGAV